MTSKTSSFLKFLSPLDVMPSNGDHTDHDYIKTISYRITNVPIKCLKGSVKLCDYTINAYIDD